MRHKRHASELRELPEEASDLPFNIVEDLPKKIDEAASASGNYPYDKRMKDKEYEEEILQLQIELLKLQEWVKKTGERILIIFEGRDGAGKGGTIARFTQHLNPRSARVVALSKPSEVESGQWYFQRYSTYLPAAGEIVFFDRSWYNRAGVERVMGFSSETEIQRFLTDVPKYEYLLANDGIHIIKFFLSVGYEMQLKRLHKRYHDPLKRWKLSPIDFAAPTKWDAYSQAFDDMLARTDTPYAPWTIVRANDKRRTRLNAIRYVLSTIVYAGRDERRIRAVDPRIVLSAARFLDNGGEE